MTELAWTLLLLCGLSPGGDGLSHILARPQLEGITVAVAVADAESGEMLFARRIDEPLAPASNMKLVTSAAALSLLGPDYHFRTRLLSAQPPDARGVLSGDLVVMGGGDPCLRSDVLDPLGLPDPAQALAGLLVQAGVKRIEGALVLDDGFLDREWVHPDWSPGDLDDSYAAPVSALSIYGNCLRYEVDGTRGGDQPQVRLVTRANGYKLVDRVAWDADGRQPVIAASQPDDTGTLTITGRLSHGLHAGPYDIPVRDGTLLFGRALRTALEAAGITVRGGLARDAGAGKVLGPERELGVLRTPLSLAAVVCNKESDNSLAEHLFKVVGAETQDDGSFEGGGRASLAFLRDVVGTPATGWVVRDGSGLSSANRVTARGMVAVLVAMNRPDCEGRDTYLRSLPVSGLDGSLRDRMSEPRYRGAVRAKTGHITGVSSLSGYAHTAAGHVLAFSILMNDVKVSNAVMKQIQDDICRDLVDAW